MQRTTRAVVVGVLTLTAFGSMANAQELARSIKVLNNKRAMYERQMETLRAQIDRAIESEQPEAGIDEWHSQGKVPELARTEQYQADHARLAETMRRGFDSARKQLSADGDESLGAAVEAMQERFDTHADLLAWGENIIVPSNAVLSPGRFMYIGLETYTDYRLEVVAKRLEGDGVLELGVPGSEGTLIVFNTTPDSNNEVHLIFSAAGGVPMIELGDPATVFDDSGRMEQQAPGMLRVYGGDWLLESIRAKPLIKGEQPGIDRRAERDAGGGDKQDARDLMPVGSTWRGDVDHNHRNRFGITLKVVEVTDSIVKLRGSWIADSVITLEYRYRGGDLSLVAVRTNDNTTRAGISGAAEVRGDRFGSSLGWRVDYGDTRGSPVEATFVLRRD